MNELYYYLKPTGSSAPRIHSQRKTHKPGVSKRPIVSYSGFLLYNLKNTQLTFLKLKYENVKDENNNAKNSTLFSNYNKNVPIKRLIKDYISNNDQFTTKTAIPQEKFLDLVHLVLTTTWYTFNSQYYQKTGGVAKGGPASSIISERYMQTYERNVISTALHSKEVWEGFFDELSSVLKRTHLETFF